jgi:hypothetical protein
MVDGNPLSLCLLTAFEGVPKFMKGLIPVPIIELRKLPPNLIDHVLSSLFVTAHSLV